MKLKVKNLNVGSGGPLVAIINYKDAEIFDLHNGDRIELKYGKKNTICILDISYVGGMVPAGRIGLFKELIKKLKVVNNKLVNLEIVRSPKSIKYIKKKMDGATLTKEEINEIISDVVDNKLSEFELAFFVAATYMRPMNNEETINLAKAMVDTGDVLKWGKRKIMDKHCIGGVAGNRTTMVVVPIIAAAGLTIPKTSSRSITSPAGTSDTMEVLCSVSFDKQQIRKIVKKTNGCLVWGGAVNFAPADDKIIKVEHSFNIDARSQLLSSILAKKASVGATHVLIDIPTGKGSKIEDKKNAELLKNDFKNIGKKLGMKIQIVFTNGTEPIGMGIGPVLEARDVLLVLKNDHLGPLDLRKKSLKMAGIMLEMGGKAKKGNGEKMATKILHSGKAYEKFIQIIKAQGGKEVLPSDLKVGKFKKDIKAWKRGRVSKIGNREISRIARVAGAPKDIGAGIFLHKKTHTYVHKGETIFTIYAHSKEKLGFALETYKALGGIEIN